MRVRGICLAWTAIVALGCGTGGDNLFGQGTASASGSTGAQTGGTSTSTTTGPTGSGGSGTASSTTGVSVGGAGNTGGEGPGPGGGGPASSSAMSSSSSSSGNGGSMGDAPGCSDGTREGYLDVVAEPNIAACAGGFDVPSITSPESMSPQCNRISGNDSANPSGTGCSVEDLCSQGWHLCKGAEDVAKSSTSGCEPSSAAIQVFWLTRQVQDINGNCIPPPGSNNITGCGSLGGPPVGGCDPLTTRMRNIECIPTLAWYCGGNNDGANEADLVFKISSDEGGVLCCKD